MRQYLPVMLTVWLAACVSIPADPDSPYYLLPKDSRVVLEQPVTIPSPGVSVWIQNGRVNTGRNHYRPACKLEMRDRPEHGRTVEPDTFRVTHVGRNQMQVSAESNLRRVAFGSRGDGPTAFEMETHIYLESARQPKVYRLVCTHWSGGVGSSEFPHYLSINQIRDTLQGIIRIELP